MSTGELNIDDLEGLVGRELDGRYLLDQFIDRGGFGVVYRGIDKKFNSPVAVKVASVRPWNEPRAVTTFVRVPP